ncbi:COMPASS complex protein [Ephemerocybe angulata]|uniref:COMPASS complex protein n=1 Tax=Ephemerocybe angulata TaxID=980116 RepID=A0A8H6IBD6_9AGAR|nr:COMPASS complex protein [Tulosesus angulatus]
MNEALINPFHTLSHPTSIQTTLQAAALFAKFDPSGRFLATGRHNGAAEIWDLETKNDIRCLDGHVKPVTSVDWSRNSRYVLTSSKDWNIVVWDLASPCDPPQRYNTLRFDTPVVSASFHPRNSRIILALLQTGEAYLCDTRKESKSRTQLKEVVDGERDGSSSRRSYMTVARFDPSGKHIFIGTSNGMLLVFRTRTKSMIASHKISGANVMKGLEFTKNGRRLVTNSSDRTLRQFTVPSYAHLESPITSSPTTSGKEGEKAGDSSRTASSSPPPQQEGEIWEQDLEPTHRFNDPINRTAWQTMSYSPDGEWLAGGAADSAAHKVYIWDLSNDGQFVSALDGGREPLTHLHWHPKKSVTASTTNQGNIHIWHCPNPERWGAFAGGFEEVDENVEYEEKENEFDIEDEAVLLERKMKAEEEDVDIDTITVATSPPSNQSILAGAGAFNPAAARSGSISAAFSKAGTPAPSTLANGAATPGVKRDSSPNGTDAMQVDTMNLDPDALWAEEDPDDDVPGTWKMKVLMEDGDDDE